MVLAEGEDRYIRSALIASTIQLTDEYKDKLGMRETRQHSHSGYLLSGISSKNWDKGMGIGNSDHQKKKIGNRNSENIWDKKDAIAPNQECLS